MTLDELNKEYSKWHNHICLLYDTDLVRFLGVAEDDMDLYYIVKQLGYSNSENWASAVGHIETMIDRLPRYKVTENLFTINDCPPTETFAVIQFQPYTNIMSREIE